MMSFDLKGVRVLDIWKTYGILHTGPPYCVPLHTSVSSECHRQLQECKYTSAYTPPRVPSCGTLHLYTPWKG